MSQQGCYAVLTGDIVDSTALSPRSLEAVRETLLAAVGEVKTWKRGLVRGKAEFFRGDAWQVLLANPARALRVAMYLRGSLLSRGRADSRVSIGLGTVDQVSRSRVSLSTGEAFRLSGQGLDGMTQYSRMTIEVPESAGALRDWLPVVGGLCDSLVIQWTDRQAEIVTLALHPSEPTQEAVAGKLAPPVSRQTVTKALDGASWHAVRSTIRQFEATGWGVLLGRREGA